MNMKGGPEAIPTTKEERCGAAMPAYDSVLIKGSVPPFDARTGVPFDSTQEAWFWFMAAQSARHDGARYGSQRGGVPRPCEPVDILRILDRLYRGRLLMMDHLRVLRYYGVRFLPPDSTRPRERRAAVLWEQALGRLEIAFIRKGIVSAPVWHQTTGAGHA